MSKTNHSYRIVFYTTILDDWGGSEELWSRAIPYLQQTGTEVMVVKNKIAHQHPAFRILAAKNVTLIAVQTPPVPKTRIQRGIKKILGLLQLERRKMKAPHQSLAVVEKISSLKPDLVVVAQGINFDGLEAAYQLKTNGIAYALISQKAVEFFWPPVSARKQMQEALLGAVQCYFVSHHNLKLTEAQFALQLHRATVVQNPVDTEQPVRQYPNTQEGLRLACIGRLFVIDKGQDLLLQILSQSKWKERNLEVSFYGTGPDETSLKELAYSLGLKRVYFRGFEPDATAIWQIHHALILPSRSEGMPLVVLEAMAAGRTVIATAAGGVSELIQNGENGFVADCHAAALEEILETAWSARNRWEEMGKKAAETIRNAYPQPAEKRFAELLLTELGKLKHSHEQRPNT